MSVEIVEVGPRDGLQNQAETLSTADKIDFIERLIAAGAKRLEIASFVNPARVPQMADAEAVIAGIPARPGVTRVGLVLNLRGVERALASGVDEIGLVAVASDVFGVRNQKQTRDASVEMAVSAIEMARDAGVPAQVTIATAFGCPFEGEVPVAHVTEMARRLAAAQPKEIALADTIGVAVPAQVERVFRAVAEAAPGVTLRAHFHNTRNTGIANALKAFECGVTRLDASTGGIGGCPFAPRATGNIGTEDLVYALERSGVETGFDLEKLTAIAPWLAQKLKIAEVPAMLSRAGGFPRGA